MQRAVFFDFDRTLIDTDALKAEQYERIARMNSLETPQVAKGMTSYIASIEDHLDFEVTGFAQYLADTLGIDPGTVIKVYLNDTVYIHDFVFPDVIQTLAKLHELGVTLGIYSQANPTHQKLKIEASGVLEYIKSENVHIYKRKVQREYLQKLPDKAFIIDDDRDVIEQIALQTNHLIPIWCNRKTNEKHPEFLTIHSLEEVPRLVVQSNN